MVLGMLGMTAFNLADTYFIGQLGTQELAAMSFTFPVVMIIGSLSQGLGVGASAVISRAIGEGNKQKIQRLTTHSLLLSVLIVGVFVVAGLLTIEPVFRLLGASDEILPFIKEYMTIWYFGVIAVVVPQVGNNAIRATGDTKTPSMVMLVAVIANIILDPLLIFGLGPFPRLELTGGALASVLSRSATLLVSIWILYSREKMITFVLPKLRELLNSWKQILYIGLPTAVTNMVVPLSAGIVTKLIAASGAEAVAAFGVANRIESFALLVVMALASVLSPFVGQNWGAQAYERADTGIRYSQRFALAWGVVMAVLLGLTGGLLASLFNSNPDIIATVRMYFLILPLSYGLYGVLKLSTIVLSVLNKPLRSSLLTLTQTFILYIPLAFFGAEFFGLSGIFSAAAISYIITGFLAYFWLKRSLAESMEYDYLQQIVTTQEITDHPASLGYWLARLYRYGRNYYDRVLSPYNLETRTLSFLNSLLHEDGLSRRDLSDKLGVSEVVTNRALSRLNDLGYVWHDDEKGEVFVTDRAKEISTNVKEVLRFWSETLVAGFSEEEKESALMLLKRMNANATDFLS
ncbi:MAG: MATE family efflux transporter [Anaerolineales bacterium]|nr:MATE family efflux transporter [Anaerolineales bacterium]